MARKKFSSPFFPAQSGTETSKPSSDAKSQQEAASSAPNAIKTKADKIQERKLKRENRDKRNLIKQKNTAPLKLNKRQLRLQREAALKALPFAYTQPEISTNEESLSCKWRVLQQNVKPDDVEQMLEGKGNKKRGRKGSVSSNSHRESAVGGSKRPRYGSQALDDGADIVVESSDDDSLPQSSDGEQSDSDGDYQDAEEELQDYVDHDAIIKSIKEQNKDKKKKGCPEEAWFDNVDPFLLETDIVMPKDEAVEVDMDGVDMLIDKTGQKIKAFKDKKSLEKKEKLISRAVALDCEMVGVGEGGCDSGLARVSIVDRLGKVIYDKYCIPIGQIKDYRTKYSGIRPHNLVDAPSFSQVQREVAEILKGRLLVGHALQNDMHALMLSHPGHSIRDTSRYQPIRNKYKNCSPSLKNLCRDYLGVTIQDGEHDSVTDARAAMRIYTLLREEWEDDCVRGKKAASIVHFNRVKGQSWRKRVKPKKNKQFVGRKKNK